MIMMEKSELDILTEKFFNGETTDEEELRLHEAMKSVQPSTFLSAQPPVPDGLEQRLSRQIDQWNIIEKKTERSTRTVVMRRVIGVAASIALVAGVGFMALQKPDAAQFANEEETFNDPEAASMKAEKALAKFSHSINKGLEIMDNATNKKTKKRNK